MAVSHQTLKPFEHLVGIDYALSGVSEMLSRLARAAEGEWLALLADDDLVLPRHLEVLLATVEENDADIAYTYCTVQGREDGWQPNHPFNEATLRQGNYIPATSLIRRSLAEELGWWRSHREMGHPMEDWDFWVRAMDMGAKFAYSEEITWVYRFHGKNMSINQGQVIQ